MNYFGICFPETEGYIEQVGISCEVIPSSIDEDLITADSPSALVEALSKAKAEDVAAHFENDFVVIGADTVVVKDSKVLGKPSNEAEAHKMLQMLQGNRHEVFTGVTLISVSGGKGLIDTFHVRTIVDMIPMTPELITSYIQTGEPMDKAAATAFRDAEPHISVILPAISSTLSDFRSPPYYPVWSIWASIFTK